MSISNVNIHLTPKWLRNLTAQSMLDDPFPLENILDNSLYYPACGLDGDPVKYLVGYFHSFIYVDYGVPKKGLLEALGICSHSQNSNMKIIYHHSEAKKMFLRRVSGKLNIDKYNYADSDAYPGFRGYRVLCYREVSRNELAPSGWLPIVPANLNKSMQKVINSNETFCVWAVFEKKCNDQVLNEMARFSLLFLYADGVAAYQALYSANNQAPKCIAVIQPGIAFGSNWTDFSNPKAHLAQIVLDSTHPTPEYLLFGGLGERRQFLTPCWPLYESHICDLPKRDGGTIGLWKRP